MHAANQFLWNANPHTLDGGSGMSEADPGTCSLPCVFRIAAIRSVLTAVVRAVVPVCCLLQERGCYLTGWLATMAF